MNKYYSLAGRIVNYLGGVDNIISVMNCETRLIIKLKDNTLVKRDSLEKTKGIKMVIPTKGNYQLVIKKHFSNIEREINNILDSYSRESKTSKIVVESWSSFVDVISNIFKPLLLPLVTMGIIKGVIQILYFSLGGIFQASLTYTVLNIAVRGISLLISIFIGYTAAKAFRGTPLVGGVIASLFLIPKLINILITHKIIESDHLPFLGYIKGYKTFIIPLLIIIGIAAYLEHRVKSFPMTGIVKNCISPFLSVLMVVPLGFLVIFPLFNIFLTSISGEVLTLQKINPILVGFILAFIWQILVLLGLQGVIIYLIVTYFVTRHGTSIPVGIIIAPLAQAGAVGAVIIKTKEGKLDILEILSFVSCLFGFPQPAICGVTFPKQKPFWISCIVSSIFGGIAVMWGIKSYSLIGEGVFSIMNTISPAGDFSGVIKTIILIIISVVAAFILTWLVEFEGDAANKKSSKGYKGDQPSKNLSREIIISPVKGNVIAPNSENWTGSPREKSCDSIKIIPTLGLIYSPVDARVTSVLPNQYIIKLASNQGVEIVIHINQNENLAYDNYFSFFVFQGQKVKKGDLLSRFSIDNHDAEYQKQVVVKICNARDYLSVDRTEKKFVTHKDNIFTVVPKSVLLEGKYFDEVVSFSRHISKEE